MTEQPYRHQSGGKINRSKSIQFEFNNKTYSGYEGDTLASALLANGVFLSARSFKYHRPRGIMGAGVEEPSCLVELLGEHAAGNHAATTVQLRDGLRAKSVNCWPSPNFDLMSINQLFSRFLPAGFYYKTFMWPNWHLFEPSIRRAAGLAAAPDDRIPDHHYETRYWYGDMLIVGGGTCGLLAALIASRSGARVMLVDDHPDLGGYLRSSQTMIDGKTAMDWVKDVIAELDANPEVTILRDATAWGYREDNQLLITERNPSEDHVFQRGWKVRASQVVLATGAIERNLIFANNDRPGIMLASAVQQYANEFAVTPGRRTVIFTNNSSAYALAHDLQAANKEVAAIIDSRPLDIIGTEKDGLDIPVYAKHQIITAHGSKHLNAISICDADGKISRLDCDLLAVSGGWNPAVHLFSQSRGTLAYDDDLASFVPDKPMQNVVSVGAADGKMNIADAMAKTVETVTASLAQNGFVCPALTMPEIASVAAYNLQPLWHVDGLKPGDKAFVDIQNDVTLDDIGLAMREGFDTVEHVKRYTTAGMGIDQGKTGNVNIIGHMAEVSNKKAGEIGTTTFRSPFTPVDFGAIAGQRNGKVVLPFRHTPITEWNKKHGAVMYEAGARWQRPGYFPIEGGTMQDAINAEAEAVRFGVGVYDGSPLGKFDISGRDAAAFIDLLYTNDFSNLETGMGRYGIMLSEDGLILDDGVTFKLADNHYMMSTSTGHADFVFRHMEYVLQVECPDWQVWITPITSQWCNATICGPKAREVMAALGINIDISAEAFPFMGIREAVVAGIPARICRVSFTGEVSFEISIWPRHAETMWLRIMEAGEPFGIVPVGSETSHVLRVEKGFLSLGHEADATADPYDLGMGWIMSRNKPHAIGRRSVDIRRSSGKPRRELVGLLPESGGELVPEGAPITPNGARIASEGFVSACVWSVANKQVIALGLLTDGRARIGETVIIRDREKTIKATVTKPCFYDPKGHILRG
ncbi:MAG: 2Fe-2S iron-sulfur cluster-binding protein [Candidatus Puniceispirillum sp.]